jgi:hypothetical protein
VQHRCRIATDGPTGVVESREDPTQIAWRGAGWLVVEGIGPAGGQPEHPRLSPRDPDRWAAGVWTPRVQLAAVHLVEGAREVQVALVQKAGDDLGGLGKAADHVVRRIAVNLPACIEFREPGAEAQEQAPTRDLVERRRHLGHQGWVAEGGAGDVRPEGDPPGDLGDGGEERPAFPEAEMLARLEVIGDPERVDARGLRIPRQRLDVGPAGRAAVLILPGRKVQTQLQSSRDRDSVVPHRAVPRVC